MNDRSTSLARTEEQDQLAKVTGAYRDSHAITQRLQYAAEHFHLVSPATACGQVPEGCSVSLSTVMVDIANETYSVGAGKVGLAKSALDKIAQAAGISWDAHQSRRLDDGSDPYYCAFVAVGRMRHLDGTEVQIMGTKEMDLRPQSPQLQAIEDRARDGGPRDKQIREMRLHILSHAESKARLRAVRAIGIRTSYKPEELRKPFVVAKIMWSGQSDDPELRRVFALKQADAMLGGSRALYGDHHAPTLQLAAPLRPPPVGRSIEADDDEPDAPPPCERRAATQARGAASVDSPAPAAKPQSAPAGTSAVRSGLTIPGGKEKGVAVEDAGDDSIEYWAGRIGKSLASGESRYPQKDEVLLAALRAEQTRRAGSTGDDFPAGYDARGDDPNQY